MRGLKLSALKLVSLPVLSHLLQMRGLKRDFCYTFLLFGQVASFTDAWIETPSSYLKNKEYESHLLQMRGLKQIRHRIKRGS